MTITDHDLRRQDPSAQEPRVTRHRWRASDGADGALIDIPGLRSRGVFIPRQHLAAVIDALADIEEAD